MYIWDDDSHTLRAGVADWGCGVFTVQGLPTLLSKNFPGLQAETHSVTSGYRVERYLLQHLQKDSELYMAQEKQTKKRRYQMKHSGIWAFCRRILNSSSCFYAETYHKSMFCTHYTLVNWTKLCKQEFRLFSQTKGCRQPYIRMCKCKCKSCQVPPVCLSANMSVWWLIMDNHPSDNWHFKVLLFVPCNEPNACKYTT